MCYGSVASNRPSLVTRKSRGALGEACPRWASTPTSLSSSRLLREETPCAASRSGSPATCRLVAVEVVSETNPRKDYVLAPDK